jgi:anti-sigma factor RsiW
MTCDDVRMSLGVYVLGALDAEEAAEVEAHLDGCPECAAELAELSGLPPMLARVSEEDIKHAATPPRAMLDRLATVSARRTRWSRIMLGLAASVMVAALGGAAWLVNARGGVATSDRAQVASAAGASQPARASALTSENQPKALDPSSGSKADAQAGQVNRGGEKGGVRLSVQLSVETGGTKVVSWVRGVPAGTVCRLWAVGKDGTRSPAGSWEVPMGYRGPYQGSTDLRLGQIERFVLSTSAGRGLVDVPI